MTTTQTITAASVTSLAAVNGLTVNAPAPSRSIQPTGRRIVVVLGMHRSGTSMTTRALQALQVSLGDDLHPAAIDNPTGFWEDRDCLRINQDLLHHLGSDYDQLAPLRQISRADPIIGELSIRAAETLKAKLLKTDGVWGFKDPRTCRLLEFWQPVMATAGYMTSFVLAVRNPISVVRSLERRDQMPAEKGYLLWLQHVVPAVLLCARSPRRIVVDYDLMMDQPLAELRRMADALDLPMEPTGPAVSSFVRDFLNESLRHSHFSVAELALDPRVPRQVAETYRILLDLANDRADIASPEVLHHFTHAAEFLADMAPVCALAGRFEAEAGSLRQAHAQQMEKAAGAEQQIAEQMIRAEAAERHAAEAAAGVEALAARASEQQRRAEAAERQALEQQRRAETAEQQALEQRRRAEAAEQRAIEQQQRAEATENRAAGATGAETRATEQQRRAEAIERRVIEQQRRAEAAEQRAVEQQRRAKAAEQQVIEQTRRINEAEEMARDQRAIAEEWSRQIRETQGRLGAIESSTSWRALHPVRRVLSSHPRVARFTRRGARLVWWSVTLQLPRRLRGHFVRRQQASYHEPSTIPAAVCDPAPPAVNWSLDLQPESKPHEIGAVGEQILRRFAMDASITPRIREALIDASARWNDRLPESALVHLLPMFVPEWHDHAGTPLESFLAYLRDGLTAGTPPGPLFDPAIYRQRAEAAGLPPLAAPENAVIHWLLYGHTARIVPTDRFDEAFYKMTYPDLREPFVWGFAHFVQHGVHEGRTPKSLQGFHRQSAPRLRSDNGLPALYRRWHALDFPDRVPALADDVPAAYERRLEELLQSDLLAQIFSVAQAADPDVGELSTISQILLPPFHDPLTELHAEVLKRLPATQYDTVICVPWVRVGGADLVAGLLGRALLRIRPGERLLYLRTDNPHFERADWLPAETDVVDISDVVQSASTPVAEHLLRLILRGVSAKRVFNVNSRLCWTTLRSYGANLAGTLKTYSYLFCWDQTPTGVRVGYPCEFFAATAATITAFLTDTSYLRDELSAMYRLPSAVRDKIQHLCTPAQTAVRTPSIARLVFERAAPSSRHLVLWAGRLDRQKRFDLVQDIARLMPDVEFRCWGAAMLDAPPDLTTLPPNIIMQGSFGRFDELPLEQAGAWLFTALWEGMPTTLIELATRGVSVVASAVGGVPELVQPDCGWLLPPDAGVEAYVEALRDALNSPEQAMLRAEKLQRRVATRYNDQGFDAALEQLLTAEALS